MKINEYLCCFLLISFLGGCTYTKYTLNNDPPFAQVDFISSGGSYYSKLRGAAKIGNLSVKQFERRFNGEVDFTHVSAFMDSAGYQIENSSLQYRRPLFIFSSNNYLFLYKK